MFKTILAAVDLEDADDAARAMETACAIADCGGGTLTLLYVGYDLPPRYRLYLAPDFDADYGRECRAKLDEWAAGLPLPQGRVSTAVRAGKVYEETLAEAERIGADLIVVGSHQPSFATRLLGSNASAVVRHAPMSVLVARGKR